MSWQAREPAAKEIQVVGEIRGEAMTRVEARHSAFCSQVVAVLWERDSTRSTVDPVRRVVDRLRPGVGDVEIQASSESLPERRLQRVVVGVGRSLQKVDKRKLWELGVERPAQLSCGSRARSRLVYVSHAEEFCSA